MVARAIAQPVWTGYVTGLTRPAAAAHPVHLPAARHGTVKPMTQNVAIAGYVP